MANGTDSAELQVCYSANVADLLLERPCLVENDTEAANRWRKRNIDLIDLHRNKPKHSFKTERDRERDRGSLSLRSRGKK